MILIYIDNSEDQVKKASLEAASYGVALAKQMGKSATGICVGNVADDALQILGEYGLEKILNVKADYLNNFDSGSHTKAIAKAVAHTGAEVVVLSHNYNGKALSARLSANLKAGLVAGATELPNTEGGFTIKKSVFSGKAFANFSINTDKKIVSINPNAFGLHKNDVTLSVEAFDAGLSDADVKVKVISVEKASDTIPLSDAELVVSAGRGLKGPENWGMIEDLATTLGAATACSRPVSDVNWRPHHEHVGQTGITIRPNLYIAVAISGAIQHLAGVNSSKTIVVINKDSEAPFFKAADYGIVGDAFEVVPKLNEAIKAYKAAV